MADKKKLEQMLEHLINEDSAKAEELFHEYVVEKSREIYESLIDAELAEESDKDEDEEMEEAAEADDEESVEESADEDSEDEEVDEEVDEEFEDVAFEGDDEEMPDMGGDPTDDLEGEMGPEDEGEEGEELGDKEPAELFQDLDAIVDELQAKFDAMGMGGEEGEMGGEEDEMKDSLDPQLATVREYVEKVSDGHGAEKKGKGEESGVNTKSTVDNMKNDMGGTTANILRADVEPESASTKGGLLNPSTKDMNTGNINTVPGKAGKAFTKKEPGHGAEKAGAKEDAENKQSLFRGRR